MVRFVRGSAAVAVIALLVGCSGFDGVRMMDHPGRVAPSSVFDAVLVNAYTYIDSNTTISARIERDSLHFMVGMPGSWNVTEASIAIVRDRGNSELLEITNGEFDTAQLRQLLNSYRTGAVAMSQDPALPSFISGQVLDLTNQNGGETTVDVDQVDKWLGFSAPVNIVFEEGSAPDTVMPFDSLLDILSAVDDSMGNMIDELLGGSSWETPESLGLCMVPVLVYLKIQAGAQEGADTLYYFSKTGSMNQTPDPFLALVAPELAAMETGDMTFMPMVVSSESAVRRGGRATLESMGQPRIVTDRATGNVRMDLGGMKGASISIFSLDGAPVARYSANELSGGNTFLWNGTDRSGQRVQSGSYVVKISGGGSSLMQTVLVTR